MFEVYISDLFLTLNEADNCNFMGDLTPYVCYASLDTVLGNLKFDSDLAIVWFEAKYIKFNCGQQYHEIIIKFTNNTIEKITYFLM